MAERTLLFGIPLHGVGTPEVESLRSFIERLAYQHSFRPRVLLEVLFEAYPLDGIAFDSDGLRKRWDIHGTSSLGQQVLHRLEKATLTQLQASTLHRYSKLFPATHLARTGDAVHCPECVLEDAGLAHGRLLWEVQCVSACPKHGLRLRRSNLCGADGDERLGVARRPALRSVCSTCGTLGFRCSTEDAQPADSEEVWVAEQVGGLLALGDDQLAEMTPTTLQRGLQQVVEHVYGGSVVRAAVKASLCRASVSNWSRGIGRPSLSALMQLCLHAKADLTALLSGNFVSSGQGDGRSTQHRVVKRQYVRARLNDEQMRAALDAAAQEPEPPSMSCLGARLGINMEVARRKFPEEAGRLKAAHEAMMEAEYRQRYADAVGAYTTAAAALKDRGEPVCEKYLQSESGLVAFSRNAPRVRAMHEVIAAHGAPRDGVRP